MIEQDSLSAAKLETLFLQHEVEQFLYKEAALLDEWRLDEWLDLFTEDARYVVPSTDLPDGDPKQDLVFIDDNRLRLQGRVNRLKSSCPPRVPMVQNTPLHHEHKGHGGVERLPRRRGFGLGVPNSTAGRGPLHWQL